MNKKPKPKDVDAFIAAAPKDIQGKLSELRDVIRKTAPAAVERISYGMPYYHYRGRLAYFNLWKEHIGLYISPPVIAEHARELEAYETNKASIRFPRDKKVPVALVRKLLKACLKKNEAKEK